jgi:4-amino-4-deoxy-L-arabinose transferase-like glycosyltransferase
MLYVSIFVELLRSRPALAVWLAALLQAAIWTLIPTLFYWGPPGNVPFVLAVGHEFQLGSYLGPPLAFWLAEVAFDLTGGHLFGVYLLSQICVVVTYWAVFALGRSIVGAQQAALAVLTMVAIVAFTVPTPEFGPFILAMPIWAIILLHYWRAVGEQRRGYWVAVAVEIGLLLLTSYWGLLLVATLALFTVVNKRARATLRTTDPWLAVVVAIVVVAPHLFWLRETGTSLLPALQKLGHPPSIADNFVATLRQTGAIIVAHAGLAVLLAPLIAWRWRRHERAPVIARFPVDTFARQFIFFFALAPTLAATFVAIALGWSVPIGGVAPLVVCSGLALVMLAGDDIELSHQHTVIAAWFGLLLIPPLTAVMATIALPWFGIDLNVNQPAQAMASFFGDSFQRRVGAPARAVAGEPRAAALVALGASGRPSLLLDATPERSPWVTVDDIKAKGGIVVWPTADTAGALPEDIRQRFPDLAPELPRGFDRKVKGRLPVLRMGWGMIRPQAQPPEGQPSATAK